MEKRHVNIIYILSDKAKKLDMGISDNISQISFNKKFTKLVYYEIIQDKSKAYKKLLKIRRQSRAVIKLLIESTNPEWLDLKNIFEENLFIDIFN
jgi:predicted GIY-YIG superfamily endonuclease